METNNESFENKTNLVLIHLQEKKSITSWEAIQLYHATRLSAIIFNLRQRGHNITTQMVYEKRMNYGIYHYADTSILK